jgi:hypothetical protein
MKTLADIARAAFNAEPFGARPMDQDPFEAVAQAVRAQVIEECARTIYWGWQRGWEAGECADLLRGLLKEKKET